jgi:hypothetical protein
MHDPGGSAFQIPFSSLDGVAVCLLQWGIERAPSTNSRFSRINIALSLDGSLSLMSASARFDTPVENGCTDRIPIARALNT